MWYDHYIGPLQMKDDDFLSFCFFFLNPCLLFIFPVLFQEISEE